MLDVFLTVDTEFWPRRPYVAAGDYLDDFRRDVDGRTPEGDFGLGYQLDRLTAAGLRAVFFVEALCANAVGIEPVREMVQRVRQGGHDVQLHLHTEWLDRMPQPLLPGRAGRHVRHFSEDEQTLLIGNALERLIEAGAGRPAAFRAGNYGANLDTLRALARNRIRFDTSYNPAYLDSACDMPREGLLLQPEPWLGVVEFPITFVRTFTGRRRPLQLTACSSGEIEQALWQAWRRGWGSVVLVWHSFELIRGRNVPPFRARLDRIALGRFERLCRFLQRHRDKFRTTTFAEPLATECLGNSQALPLRARAADTLVRWVEQLTRRMSRQ